MSHSLALLDSGTFTEHLYIYTHITHIFVSHPAKSCARVHDALLLFNI